MCYTDNKHVFYGVYTNVFYVSNYFEKSVFKTITKFGYV
jgi:hypothetical protein